MMFVLLVLLAACLALVLWNVGAWPAVEPRAELAAKVSVLIPARNEEANLAACLDSVRVQPCIEEILIYNDDSSDATSAIAADYARRDARIRMVEPRPLPPGWCGKPFACWRLAAEAHAPWLLFLDADARLLPGAVPGIVGEARERSASLLSCWPGLTMVSFAEKLLMPMLNFVVFTAYPAALGVSSDSPSLGLAHGACILVSKWAYDAVGGHAAVASEIFEDTRLARIWRERGESSVCLDGRKVVHVHMYKSAGQIWRGFQKNLRTAFRSAAGFWAFMMAHAVLFLLPFVVGVVPALLVISIRLLLARRFGHPFWSALLHPAAECFLLALGLSSFWRWRARGDGVVWKGRVYRRA